MRIRNAKVLAVFLFTLIFVGAIGSARADEPNRKNIDKASADYVGIARAVEFYFEAGRQGDSSYMKKVFLPEANIYAVKDGKLIGGPIELLYDMVEGKASPTEIVYQIAAVDVAVNIAVVRLEIDDWAGHAYTDMFTMIKDGEDWKIASKVSLPR